MKILIAIVSLLAATLSAMAQGLTRYVDPLIGSEGLGRVFVGPCAPFGMAKPGPDCLSMPNAGWAPMPEAVKGFSQTHVSGTGGGQKYGNVLIQPIRLTDHPTTKRLLMPDGSRATVPVYASQRTAETVSPGRYACTFDNGIDVELTASARCAIYRIDGADALLIDAASFLGMDTIPNKREAQQYVASHVEATGPQEISGYTTVRGGWNNGDAYTVYFCLQADKPFGQVRVVDAGGNEPNGAATHQPSLYAIARLAPGQAQIKVGISYVSVDRARQNISPLSFDAQHEAVVAEWDSTLDRVPYRGTQKEMRMFYTALYHTLLMPTDKTGENPRWTGGPYYDDYYALWDTYRTSFPLLMEYYPERAVEMVNSLLAIYRHDGYMPDARSGDCNGRTQGGSHAEVVVAEAFARGLKGIDYDLALQAMLKEAEVEPADDEREGRGGLAQYNSLGYIPYGIPRAGTRTVEYSYDDWCIAQVARGLGRDDLYIKYMARSGNWRNLWREDYEWQGMRGFIMPRDAEGRWLDSVVWGKSKVFHPRIAYKPDTKVAPWYIPWWDTFFYEALSAEYSLSIPHDVPALVELCGGREAFRRRLDTFFDNGHYNVANEPSFLTPYLYHYIGRPELSEQRVAQIVTQHFTDRPDGLPGNDDSGAMSSWLIWAMLGKYPVAGQNKWLEIAPVHIPDTVATAKQAVNRVAAAAFEAPQGATTFDVHYTLNRQYRTWRAAILETDTMVWAVVNGCRYAIPHSVAEGATGFSWQSPQRPGALYDCSGTFLFISRTALRHLLSRGWLVYDGITWRQQRWEGDTVELKADKDGTRMWIATAAKLPMVVRVEGNPLGIDWYLSPVAATAPTSK